MMSESTASLVAVVRLGRVHDREHAIEQLLPRGDEAIRALIDASKEPPDVHVWEALAHFGSRAADQLISIRGASSSLSGYGEARVLALSPKSWPTLRKALESDDAASRCAAAEGLGLLGDQRAITALRATLADPVVGGDAAVALARLRDRESLPTVLTMIDDPDPDIATAAVHASSLYGDASLERLIQALQDARLEVRIESVAAVGKSTTDRATAALVQRLEDLDLPGDDLETDEIILALQTRADPRSESALTEILRSAHASERSHPLARCHGDLAASALEAIGTSTAISAAETWRHHHGIDDGAVTS
jgi:hypothetical protein